ncbi:MAG TPA: ABC transporter permease [Candidatus Acidoferrum sp.]|jgi:putative ABC transport system permease protein|nr:ABC transporter permease [Candidatus Acidoferrum sp.]
MAIWRNLQSWLSWFPWDHHQARDADLARELRDHLDLEADEQRAAGLSPKEAAYAAHRALGNTLMIEEDVRAVWGFQWLETLVQDVRYGMRMLRKSPGFAAIAILTLALGIGANAAIFSIVNIALLRPLAYAHPEQLYLVREIVPQFAKFYPTVNANLPDFRIWQKQVHAFADVALAEATSADLTGAGEAESISGMRVSANILSLLGVRPALGRPFRPEEDESGHGHVVMLTNSFWRERFHGDPAILGKSVTLDGAPHEIVGVLPASFRFPSVAPSMGGAEDYARMAFFEPLDGPKPYETGLIGEFDFIAIARLKPDTTESQAHAELNVVQTQISKQANDPMPMKGVLLPLEETVVGPARSGLIFMLAAVAAVLLIICANLASLLLARVPGRMREAAIRTALGATRGRMVGQMLTESLLLSIVGGALGVGLGRFALRWLVSVAPTSIPRMNEIGMDARALVFALAVTLLTGILFGILPAWRVRCSHPIDALKSGATATTESSRTRRLRECLVGFEVGVTALLLILAGLLTTSLARVLRVHAGFDERNALLASVNLPPQSYAKSEDRLRFYNEVVAGAQALPGVRAAGWVSIPPLGGQGSVTGIALPGENKLGAETPVANYRPVSPDYFSAMGIPLVRGRVFGPADRGRKVVVVSQNVADRFWPGQNPIGKICVAHWGPDIPAEVIGLVSDIRTVQLAEAPLLMVYVPEWFNAYSVPMAGTIVLRTASDPAATAGAVRELIRKADAQVPITTLEPMTQIVSTSVDARRFSMLLAMAFAVSSLLLASLGILGVVGYSVEQRRHELGIRLALGAEMKGLMTMIIGQSMRPVVTGLAVGIVAAVFAGRLISSLLFGVEAYDAVTLTVVASVVTVGGLTACYIPARRATRVDPMVALRYE